MHLMIDLETLGTDTNCVVTQIGYCLFDLDKPKSILFFDELHLDPQEQINYHRTITWPTLCWWNEQGEAARNNMFGKGKHPIFKLREALVTFKSRVEQTAGSWNNIEGVWGHGISFDIMIMQDLFALNGERAPWSFRAPRDTRTLFMLNPDIEMVKADVKHSAMADAIAQALTVQKHVSHIKAYIQPHDVR